MGLIFKWIKRIIFLIILGWAMLLAVPAGLLYWAKLHPDNGYISSPDKPGSIISDTYSIPGAPKAPPMTVEELNRMQNAEMMERNRAQAEAKRAASSEQQ